MLPLFVSGLLSYLVGMKRRTSRHVTCKENTSHFLYIEDINSFAVNTKNIFIECNENISIFTSAKYE